MEQPRFAKQENPCHLSDDNGPGTFTQSGPLIVGQTGPAIFTQTGPLTSGKNGPRALARLLKSGHAPNPIQTLKRREHARQEEAYHGYS